MKITKIEVSDFRGFPGPAIYDFEFGNANNLLIYGENGSGKSSLFSAVREFFNLDSKAKPFAEFRNLESPEGTSGHVTVKFDNEAEQTWRFGDARPLKEAPASQTALRVGCLDYQALLETNFSQRVGAVNLFDIAVRHLVARLVVPVSGGGSEQLGKLWEKVLARKPPSHHSRNLIQCQNALDRFNEAFEPVIAPLVLKATELLQHFPNCDYDLRMAFQPVEYDKSKRRAYKNCDLILSVHRSGELLADHHNFLNEARLSAIGLVIYLAGLLISVPQNSRFPKLLVLDDVLIGLDIRNRIPVIELVAKYFGDWQVVLLTHDLTWYEMVRLHFAETTQWTAYKMRLGTDQLPVHRLEGDQGGAAFFLERARRHLAEGDLRASGTYARSAFEWKLKKYREEHRLSVPYSRDPAKITAESLWNAAKEHARKLVAKSTPPDPLKSSALEARIIRVEAVRTIFLNPLSHSATAPVQQLEVERAIDAVEYLGLP